MKPQNCTNTDGSYKSLVIFLPSTEPSIPSIIKTNKKQVIHEVTSLSSDIGASIETLTGSSLLLFCNATGFPTPQIKWSITGKPITNGRRYIISNGGLRIFGLKPEDSSAITCTASNVIGQDSATTGLVIKGISRGCLASMQYLTFILTNAHLYSVLIAINSSSLYIPFTYFKPTFSSFLDIYFIFRPSSAVHHC